MPSVNALYREFRDQGFEVLLIASYGLLLSGGRGPRLRSGLHYVAFNIAASTLFLVAVGLVYGLTGALNMAELAHRVAQVPGVSWAAPIAFASGSVAGPQGRQLSYLIGYDTRTGRGGPPTLAAGRIPGAGEAVLDEQAAAGTSIFVSTHAMDEVERCDLVGVMYSGRLIANNSPGGLKGDFSGFLYHVEAEPLLVDGYEGLLRGRGAQSARTAAALGRLVAFYEGQGNTVAAAAYRASTPEVPPEGNHATRDRSRGKSSR